MQLGFTGTQRGVTPEQWATCWSFLCERAPGSFHHGDCIGADDQIAGMARLAGYRVVGHPPSFSGKRAWFASDENWPVADYLVRNHAIVNSCQEMLACPGGPEQLRSGTWSTIRFAIKVRRRVTIVLPDGSAVML